MEKYDSIVRLIIHNFRRRIQRNWTERNLVNCFELSSKAELHQRISFETSNLFFFRELSSKCLFTIHCIYFRMPDEFPNSIFSKAMLHIKRIFSHSINIFLSVRIVLFCRKRWFTTDCIYCRVLDEFSNSISPKTELFSRVYRECRCAHSVRSKRTENDGMNNESEIVAGIIWFIEHSSDPIYNFWRCLGPIKAGGVV